MKLNRDMTRISFGQLSQEGVVAASPLANPYRLGLDAFTSENFQYIADHILDMFGYAHGTVQITVGPNDWVQFAQQGGYNTNTQEVFQMQVQASILPAARLSLYGRHFMFQQAMRYGYPILFGIIAHEMGHMLVMHSLHKYEIMQHQGRPWLFETTCTEPYWNELCSDYFAGIVLAMANPPLEAGGLVSFLAGTLPDEAHPHGFYREYAVKMGVQWAQAHTNLIDRYALKVTGGQSKLLISFFQEFSTQFYGRLPAEYHRAYGQLPAQLLMSCRTPIGPV